MFRPIPAQAAASMPNMAPPADRHLQRIEWVLAGLTLTIATILSIGLRIALPAMGGMSMLKIGSCAMLIIALPGMWIVEQVAAMPLSSTANLWAAVQQLVLHGSAPRAVARRDVEAPPHALAALMADVILQLRRLQNGRLQGRDAARSTNVKLQAGRDQARQLALALRSDGASLADAASGIMLASSRIAEDTSATLSHANDTEREVGAAIERATGLAASMRATTVEIGRMTRTAITASDAALGAQRSVAALDGRSEMLAQTADQVRSALQTAAKCGQAFSLAGAKQGEDGRAVADSAAELQQMAAATEQTLSTMQLTLTELRVETGEASRRMIELSDLIQAQHVLGQSIAQSIDHQSNDIGAMLHHLSGAHAGFATLRAGVDAVTRSSTTRLSGAEALRGAANRLPEHAEAISNILRGIPDFVPPLDF